MRDWATDCGVGVADRRFERLAILATDLKSAPVRVFFRRIRVVVQFPFPDAAARLALSRRQIRGDVRGAGHGPH